MADRTKAAVVSLHYAYAFTSHMIAVAKLLQALGFAVTFIVDERYLASSQIAATGEAISARVARSGLWKEEFDLAIICNPAVGNHVLARSLRPYGTKIFYIFHEPESVWSPTILKSEGVLKAMRFFLSTHYSCKTLRCSSGAIVCSSFARRLYGQNYLRWNANVHVIPLLFDDEIGEERFGKMKSQKRYFGYVGTACKAHGFERFVGFAKFAVRNGSNIPFLIATWVDLSSLLESDRELAGYVERGEIRVQHGRELSNDEINKHSLECFCIWNVYRRSTQSGVLPRSFMAGTPVLASRVGSFPEEVQPGFTGEFADVNENPVAILAMVQNLREHATDYFDECRKRFLGKFYFRANLDQLTDILESTSVNKSIAKTVPTSSHRRRA